MFIKVNGVRLFYEKMGSGPAMIMVHGNEEDHRIHALYSCGCIIVRCKQFLG